MTTPENPATTQPSLPEQYAQVTFNFEFVTPPIAVGWLETLNSTNRKINKSAVKRLGADLAAGKFLTTHQGIAFDSMGGLLDGQHRLKAIVLTGVSSWMLVSRGWPSTVQFDDGSQLPTFTALDAPGNARTTRMFLHSMGVQNDRTVALLCLGYATFTGPYMGHITLTNSGVNAVFNLVKPHALKIAELAAMPGIVKVPGAALWAFGWAHTIYPEATEALLADTIQASGDEASPARMLAFSLRQQKGFSGGKLRWKVISLTASALQAKITGEKVERLRGGVASYHWLVKTNKELHRELTQLLSFTGSIQTIARA
jgi:hypothetical protein